MNVAKVQIKNILGIEQQSFEAGQFNRIEGQNGSGKTSFLEAIKSLFKQSDTGTLLRNGAKTGEVVLVLDDGMEIKRTVTPTGSKVSITKDGMSMQKPTAFLQTLVDAQSFNPISFLHCTKKQRVEMLLESMPLETPVTQLREITGVDVPADVPALDAIERVHKHVYDLRTGENKAHKEKKATADKLGETLTDTKPIDSLKEECRKVVEQIATLESNKNKEVGEARLVMEKAIEEARQQFEKRANEINESYSEQITTAKSEEQRLRSEIEDSARVEKQKELFEQMSADSKRHLENSENLTNQLNALNELKLELMQSLPIEGLAVVNGEVMYNDVAFERLNTAQQITLAVELAKLRAGELGLVCLDGMEALSEDTFAEFEKSFLQTDLQAFVTRVSNGPLTIEKAA